MRSSMLVRVGATLLAAALAGSAWADEPATADTAVQDETAASTGDLGADALEVASDPAGSAEGNAQRAGGEPRADEPELSSAPTSPASQPEDEAPASSSAEAEGSAAAAAGDEAAAEPVLSSDAEAPAPAASAETEGAAPVVSGDAKPAETPSTLASPAPESPAPRLGAIGYDEQGRSGRIHVVAAGDTLWDISEAYLGTAWVWPSIWKDNRSIENPHLIHPGDHIWITETEMRPVSREEAEALLAGRPAAPQETPEEPARPEVVAKTPVLAEPPPEMPTRPVSSREMAGLVTAEELESAASIVDAQTQRVMLGQPDRVHVGLGVDAVAAGDQFTIFRTKEKIFDPDNRRLLGYHVEILGWLEVLEPTAETSLAMIRQSVSEIERGDRIIPREPIPTEVAIGPTPSGVEGKLSFFPQSRTLMGMIDYVYLNRGTLDGLEVGSPLEVYREGSVAEETARHERVQVPDHVIAELLVVKAQPESAVALVTHTEGELHVGDRFRGAPH